MVSLRTLDFPSGRDLGVVWDQPCAAHDDVTVESNPPPRTYT